MPTIKQPLAEKAILEMLEKHTVYLCNMVDTHTNRFYYRCLPLSGKCIHEHCPIRDIAVAWDMTTLLRLEKELRTSLPHETADRLEKAVCRTIEAFSTSWESFKYKNCFHLDRKLLLEPPNIAHSAFLILAMCGAVRLGLLDQRLLPLNNLVNGILIMQKGTGAYRIHFGHDDIYSGIEFYPGEACLALMDVWDLANECPSILSGDTHKHILFVVERAFYFYSNHYYNGNVTTQFTSFFGNWQTQTFARLFDTLQDQNDDESADKASAIANYIFDLCRDIVTSDPWETLACSSFDNVLAVEIACGLEALADGTRIALKCARNQLASQLWRSVIQAIHFLQKLLEQVPKDCVGYGGIGHTFTESEQRLDVTGHVVNALTKVYKVYHENTSTLDSLEEV